MPAHTCGCGRGFEKGFGLRVHQRTCSGKKPTSSPQGLSERMQKALTALDTYGLLAAPTGSWTRIPVQAFAPQVTLEALVRRNLAQWDNLELPSGPWPCVVKVEEQPD